MRSTSVNSCEPGPAANGVLRGGATHGLAALAGALAAFAFGSRTDDGSISAALPLEPPPAVRSAEPPESASITPSVSSDVIRVPVPVEPPVVAEPVALDQLSCAGLRTELTRRITELEPAMRRALTECGFGPADLMPWGLVDAIVSSPGDRVQHAAERGDKEEVAAVVGDVLLELQGSLNLDLRTKLQVEGVAPIYEVPGLVLSDHLGTTTRISMRSLVDKDGKTSFYFIESVNGGHRIYPVPEKLRPEADLLLSLQQAEKAAEGIDR